MEKQDLSQLSTNDLREKLKEQKEVLAKMKFNHAISPVENPMKIRQSRRFVATLNTELHKRQLQENTKK